MNPAAQNTNPQLIQMALTLGIDPKFVVTPQGVSVLKTMAQLAEQGLMSQQLPAAQAMQQMQGQAAPGGMAPSAGPPPIQNGAQELRRSDPYAAMSY